MNVNQLPKETQGQLLQEYSYNTEGCTVNNFVQEIYNDDYSEVDGDFEILMGTLEDENFITEVLEGVVNRNIQS